MKREEAYYFKILLSNGFSDEFEEWLDSHLKTENPLSDIVLKLSFCASDTNKVISCLHNYCLEETFDVGIVRDMIRIFLKRSYVEKRFSKEELYALMHSFAITYESSPEMNLEPFSDMLYVYDYYLLAEEGIISMDKLDQAVYAFLGFGERINYDLLWNTPKKKTWIGAGAFGRKRK